MEKCFLVVIYHLWLFQSFCLLFQNNSWFLHGGLWHRFSNLNWPLFRFLFSVCWLVVGLWINCSLLKKEVYLTRMADAPIYGYTENSLVINLILCQFIWIMVVYYPLGPIACLAIGYRQHCQVWALLCTVVLESNRKLLVTPMIFMALLCQWACIARIVFIVAHRVHSW